MAAAGFNTKQDRPHLVRAVGLTSLTALAVNGMVGSGIFVLPAQVAAIVGPASLLAYGIAGLAAGLMVLCFAEVATLFDGSGGPYLYARAAFGDWVGFEIGWMLLLSRLTAIVLAVIWERRFLDFRRVGLVHNAAELKAQVVEVAVLNGVFLELFNDGLEVG